MHRPSYMLEDLKPFITQKVLICFIIFIMWHFIVTVINMFVIFKQMFKNKFFSNLTQKISSIITLIYWKPLDYIHNLIIPHIPMSGRFFVYVEKVWAKKANVYFYVLIFLFEIILKTLLAVVFLVEVIVFGQIKVFLHIISLILITIMWNIFLKAFAYCGTINLPIIKVYFSTIRGVGEATFDSDGNVSSYSSYEFIIKPEYDGVITICRANKKDTEKVMPYVTIITSLIYVIGECIVSYFFLFKLKIA